MSEHKFHIGDRIRPKYGYHQEVPLRIIDISSEDYWVANVDESDPRRWFMAISYVDAEYEAVRDE